MKMEDLEFGIRVTGSYRSPIERQIAEAVKIEREVRKGKRLLNSKSEFNLCELPRLTVGNQKQAAKELREEDEETKKWKDKLRKLKKRKKDNKIEEEMRNPSLCRVCLEILNENTGYDIRRKIRKLGERKNIVSEKDEKIQQERRRRRVDEEKKKKECLRSLRLKGKYKITEEEKRKIELRKQYWRVYRETVEEFERDVEERSNGSGNISNDDACCQAAAQMKNYIKERTGRGSLRKENDEKRRLEAQGKDIGYPETFCLKYPNINSQNFPQNPKIPVLSSKYLL